LNLASLADGWHAVVKAKLRLLPSSNSLLQNGL
jgi:hypothetical protein